MSYTPTTWATGDTVTSAKLNNMETGIADLNLVIVNFEMQSGNTAIMDKTIPEICTAFNSGKRIYLYGEVNGTTFKLPVIEIFEAGNITDFVAFGLAPYDMTFLLGVVIGDVGSEGQTGINVHFYTLTPMS